MEPDRALTPPAAMSQRSCRLRRLRLLATAPAAVVALLVGAPVAPARVIEPPLAGVAQRGPYSQALHDRVLPGRVRAARARAASATARYFTSADGYRIQVELSRAYSTDERNWALAAQYVSFLSSRVHGPELAKLRVYIGSPREIRRQCGSLEAVACYSTRPEYRMYVPGEQGDTGIPVGYAVTHEYGHHIASFRRNALSPAFAVGPQYWASYVHMCSGVMGNPPHFFPGDEEFHYADNPGEGWADAYAHLPEHGANQLVFWRDIPFQFNPRFLGPEARVGAGGRVSRLDEGAVAAIRRDVLSPWFRMVSRTFTGTLRGSDRLRSFRLRSSLDGPLSVRLTGPARATFDLRLIGARGRVLAQARGRGANKAIKLRAFCRPVGQSVASTSLRVVRRSGAGPFRVRVVSAG